MVFQAYTSFGWLTVRENVEYGLRLQGRAGGRAARAGRSKYLKAVGLRDFADRYPKDLSGGMKQRVAIARTLINKPRVVLMDEPFGALDPQTRWGMQGLLLDVSRTEDNTILFVTHDVSEAVYLADTVYVLSRRPGADPAPRRRAVLRRCATSRLKSSAEFRAVEKRLLDMLYAPAAPARVECAHGDSRNRPTGRRRAAGTARPAPRPPGVRRRRARAGRRRGGEGPAKAAVFEKRPYLKFAFSNPYNLSLFGGALAAAGLTLNPFLAIVAVGLEALWLLYAPDSKRLRHLLWDPRFDKLRQALEAEERGQRLGLLGPAGPQARRAAGGPPGANPPARRAEPLVHRRPAAIGARQDGSPRRRVHRHGGHLRPLRRLPATRWTWTRSTATAPARAGGAGRRGRATSRPDLARKNLAIILKRQEKMKEIRRYLGVARGQLDLIENSFQLIADQIVTMQSPQELSGQLDELLDGVESIRQTAVDTEAMLETPSNPGARHQEPNRACSPPGPRTSAAATSAARRRCSSSTATSTTPSSSSSAR